MRCPALFASLVVLWSVSSVLGEPIPLGLAVNHAGPPPPPPPPLVPAAAADLARRIPPGAILRERAPQRAVQFGKPPEAAYGNARVGSRNSVKEDAANYLITLERNVTNPVKDKILDQLMRNGCVIKQVYDYRVFKGILFTIPSSADKGLTSWQQTLGKEPGIKYVEEDSIVKIQ
ncbi:hypothetical protein JCM10212_001648 [Sporobolomyces blumeae]